MVIRRSGISPLRLMRLGRECAGERTPAVWLHRAALAGAAAALVLAFSAFAVAHSFYAAMDQRIAARSPRYTADPAAAAGYSLESGDSWRNRQFSVVYLARIESGAAPPAGLTSWPRPGTAVLSPALLAADPTGTLAHRFGTPVGTIGAAGLATSGEWLVYVGASVQVLEQRGPAATPLTGFGVPDSPASPVQRRFISQEYTQSQGAFDWIVAFTMLLPALIWSVTAARTGAVARDRRLALIHALGGAAKHRRWIVIGEALPWIALGAATGSVVGVAVAWFGVDLPVVHFDVAAGDGRAAIPLIVGATLFSMAAQVLSCAVLHPRQRRVGTVRPIARRSRLSLWRLLLVVAAYSLVISTATHPTGGAVLPPVALSTYFALAVTPFVVGHLILVLGRGSHQLARRRGWAAALVGAAWLCDQPRTAMRLGAALIIGVGLIGQIQAAEARLGAPESVALAKELSGPFIPVDISATDFSSARDARFAALLPHAGVLAVEPSDHGGVMISASCSVWRSLGAVACPASATDAARVFPGGASGVRSLIGNLAGPGGGAVVSVGRITAADEPEDQLIVLQGAGATRVQIEQAAYAAFTGPWIFGPGEVQVDGMSQRGLQGDWFALFGLVGLPMLMLAGALAWLGILTEQAKAVGALGAFTGTRGFYRKVAAWNLAVPLLAASVVAALSDFVLGTIQLVDGGVGADLFSVPLWAACIVMCVLVTAIATAVGSSALRRTAQTWRPRGE